MAGVSTRSSLRLAHVPPPSFPLTSQPRQSSPELGDPLFQSLKASNTSGTPDARPKRKSAGKKAIDPEYIDSNTIPDLEDPDMPDMEVSSDHSVSDHEKSKKSKAKAKKAHKQSARKRKRAASPPAPPLSPIHSDVEELSDDEGSQSVTSATSSGMISLTFHVPKGFQGPFVVQLDPQILGSATPQRASPGIVNGRHLAKRRRLLSTEDASDPPAGFMALPPELRNKIYRLIFVTKDDFKFWDPHNFSRSAAFLRTCKQVNEEGSSILYSENAFYFERSRHLRAQYWASERKEIGYKDMRRFLTDIGPRNLSYIRKFSVTFEDANPSSTPHDMDTETRRFVNDEHLLECLRILSKQCKLKWLRLSFQGRRKTVQSDHRFVDTLSSIRTDKLNIAPNPRYSYHSYLSKVDWMLQAYLEKRMVRKEKLFLDISSD